jgi:hypothetical protein
MLQPDNVPLHSGVQSLLNDHEFFFSISTDWSIKRILVQPERTKDREREMKKEQVYNFQDQM